jgi:transposase
MNANQRAFSQSLTDKSKEEIITIALSLYEENEKQRIQLTYFQAHSSEMAIQFQQMKDELCGAKAECETLRKLNMHLTGVNSLQAKELFGRSSEKSNDILNKDPREVNVLSDPLDEDADGEEAIIDIHKQILPFTPKPPRNKKKKGKRKSDLSELPSCRIYEYDIVQLNAAYGEGNWRFAFWNERKTVERIPQSTYVLLHYTPILSVGLEHELIYNPAKNRLIPKSLASPSLLAAIITDKYALFIPLHRQENDPHRFGFPLSRQTMSNWIVYVCRHFLIQIYQYMCEMLRTYPYQQCDETTYQVIHDGRESVGKSYIWAHRTSELLTAPPIIVYCYEKTRQADHLYNFYKGETNPFTLTCDAYSAYPSFAKNHDGAVTLTGCLMHARRRYVNALSVIPKKNLTKDDFRKLPEVQGIDLIKDIYHADEPLKEKSCEERLKMRQALVKEKVDAYFDFVNNFDTSGPSIGERLKDAIQYSKNQEVYLRRFLDDGNIPIDNGANERIILPIAQGRRNYLFSNTISGAEATVICSSLIVTAKANEVDPYYYLKYLFEKMPTYLYETGKAHLPEMMPWSDTYRRYETSQRKQLADYIAPPSNEKPRTPRKKDAAENTA